MKTQNIISLLTIILLIIIIITIFNNNKSSISNKELYKVKCEKLLKQAKLISEQSKKGFVRENSNHTYRGSQKMAVPKINMKDFVNILNYDTTTYELEVEGNIKIKDAIKYLLKKNRNLVSCPDLKDLTLGGIISGVGGGNTSFNSGYFHNQITEMDILTSNPPKIITLKKNDDLFKAIPRSMGTLGYVTRLKIKTKSIKPYVRSNIYHFNKPKPFYETLIKFMKDETIDFLDSTVFSKNKLIIVTGTYVNSIPDNFKLENVANRDVYYEEIQKKNIMYFKTYEFIYRFSTDLYYTTLSLPKWLRSKTLRRMIPKKLIEPTQKLIGKFLPVKISKICQDVLIPIENAETFFEWYDNNINIYPLYNVPVKSNVKTSYFWDDTTPYIDFGIAYGVLPDKNIDQDKLCRKIEIKMMQLNGVKLPYTNTNLNETEFWKHFGEDKRQIYENIRLKYNMQHFPNLYDKVKNKK